MREHDGHGPSAEPALLHVVAHLGDARVLVQAGGARWAVALRLAGDVVVAVAPLDRAGLRLPSDMSVIGFDDHPMAQYFNLTTICQDVRDQGRQIAQQLVGAVVRPGEAPPVELHAPTRLVVRGTTAVLGTEQRPSPALRTAGGQIAGDRWLFEPAGVGQTADPV